MSFRCHSAKHSCLWLLVVVLQEQAGFHTVGTCVRNETLASAVANSTWQRIIATVPAGGVDRSMQLQFAGGPGMMWVDSTFIGANLSATRGSFKTDDNVLGQQQRRRRQQQQARPASPVVQEISLPGLTVPPYPPLAPPFPPTWQLNQSTIIHTSNKSGWTDTASAARFGIISFDAQNAEAIWLTPNRSQCTAEEAMIEQARRVKAASPSTKVLVYRNVMWALQWLSSNRAAMEDPAKADFFLQYSVPTPPPKAAAGNIYYTQAHEGNQYLWNYSNPEAVKYFCEVVVMGKGGVGSPLVSGLFFDDPGPSTAEHPMQEYLTNIQAAAKAINMSVTELQTLATDTHTMVVGLRQRLQSEGKMIW